MTDAVATERIVFECGVVGRHFLQSIQWREILGVMALLGVPVGGMIFL
jgi:hypothetical protein